VVSWVRHDDGRQLRLGVLAGAQVALLEGPGDLLRVLDGRAEASAQEALTSGDRIPLTGLRPAALLETPPSIRDFMSFEQHVHTLRTARGSSVPPLWYEQPTFYFSNPGAVVGPRADVAVSPGSAQFDYEIEIGAVIGTGGRDIEVGQAARHIAGFTLFCDWSARDLQLAEMTVGLGPAKGKDGAISLGPVLVSPDELAGHLADNGGLLHVTGSVNGIVRTDVQVRAPHWSFDQMVAYASRGTALRPGDVIGSGTVGTGCLSELRATGGPESTPWLQPGDLVRIEAGPLGVIESRITEPAPVRDLGPAAGAWFARSAADG